MTTLQSWDSPLRDWRGRMRIALFAGSVSIGANTGLLLLADAVGFTTSHGGLLRFARDGIAAVSAEAGTAIVPLVSSATFQTAFHVAVGLLMAIFYAFALEPILAGPAWLKGFVYAAGVWLLNAFVMLPAIGESIAGSRHLDLSGMIGFAVIHTVFFILLAVLYARLEARQAMRERPS